MKVFQVIFEVDIGEAVMEGNPVSVKSSVEIEEQVNYWTGPDIQTVCTAAAKEAHEYDKDLKAVREVLIVTQHIK